MKNLIFVLFSFVIMNVSYAQERLTNKVGEGTSVRNILRQIDSEKYIISMDNFDSVHVYLMIEDVPVLQHSRQYYGVFSETFLTWSDHYLLTETTVGSVAYNFVTDEETVYPYLEGFNYTSWRHSFGDHVILRRNSQDFNLAETFLVDLDSASTYELDSEWTALDQTSQYILLRDYIDEDNSFSVLMDKSTYELDTIVNQYFYAYQYVLDEEKFVYLQDDQIKSYDLTTKMTNVVYDLPIDYRGVRIRSSDADVFVNISNQDFTKTLLVINDSVSFDEYNLSSQFDEVYPRVIGDKIIGDDNGISVYDINTGLEESYFVYPPKLEEVVILEDRYLVARENGRASVIDLQNNTHTIIFDEDVGGYENASFFQLENNNYLFNFDGAEGRYKSMIELNTEDLSAQFSDVLNVPSNGLSYDSDLIEVNGQLFLISDDIYHVHEGNAVKLNQNEIRDAYFRRYKLIDNQLYWIEVTSGKFTVNTFDNELGDQEVAEIPGHVGMSPWNWLLIDNYTVVDNYVYYIDDAFTEMGPSFTDFLWRYDIESNEKIQVLELSFNSKLLASHNGYVYFADNGALRVIEPNGNIMDLMIPVQDFLFGDFYFYLDQVLFVGSESVYRLEGAQKVKLFDIPTFSFVSFEELDSGLWLYDDDYSYIYDGVTIEEFEFDGNRPVYLSDDYYMTSVSVGTNTNVNSIHQISTGNEYVLPDTIASLRIAGLFPYNDRLVLVGSSGFFPFQEVTVYSIDTEFTDFELINNFDSGGRGVRTTLATYEQEAFLYAGSRFFLMNENLDFFAFDNLGGDAANTIVKERDGYFYFVAFGSESGRQLYRVQVYSERSFSSPLLHDDREWGNVSFNDTEAVSSRMRLSDNLRWIDGSYYHEVEKSDSEFGDDFIPTSTYLKEESGQVWQYSNDQKILAYDFNLVVGDTLNVDLLSSHNEYAIVVSLDDMIIENGDIRKRWTFSSAVDNACDGDTEYYYMEGVGSNRGLVYHNESQSLNIGCSYLTCLEEMDVLVYRSQNFTSCFVVSTNDVPAFDLKVYPNPAATSIQVESDEEVSYISLFDMLGNQVIRSSTTELKVSDLLPGMYVLEVTIKSGESVSQRVIVE